MGSRARRGARLGLLALLVAPLAGCGVLRTAAEAPGRVAGAVLPGGAPAPPPTENLLPDLMRYADMIVFRVDEASRDFEAAVGTAAAELQAARWRLATLRGATQIAAGPNALAGLLDLVVLATTFRCLHEDHLIPEVWGEPARPMLVALQQSELDGWKLLERYLPAAQVEAARTLLADWRRENPKLVRESLLQYPSFTALAEGRISPDDRSGASLMGMVGLDPLSGLEPAVREIELARQLGVRALYFAQRAPRLVAAEIEIRTREARASNEVLQVLADTERVTVALESFAATAAGLPAALSTELDAQRAGLLADLERSQAPLESLLRETRATLAAGTDMSVGLTAALGALDAFVGRFDEPEQPEQAAAAPSAPPGKPFDVGDYGAAAERIGGAVRELNALVTALDEHLPEAQRLLDEAAARGERTVDHVLWRALLVGLILIGAASLAAFLVRRAGRGASGARRPG